MKAIFSVLFLALFVSATPARAAGECLAADPRDHYWRSVCSHKSEQLCKWEENCRWAYGERGTCEARDANDHYWRSVCSHKSEQLCKWEENCVWND